MSSLLIDLWNPSNAATVMRSVYYLGERFAGPLLWGQSGPAMDERKHRIDEIEADAAESDLISCLASDPAVRIHNRRLAEELRECALKLRAGQPTPQPFCE